MVTFRYGQFSHLWVDMMQRLGLDVSVPSSRTLHADQLHDSTSGLPCQNRPPVLHVPESDMQGEFRGVFPDFARSLVPDMHVSVLERPHSMPGFKQHACVCYHSTLISARLRVSNMFPIPSQVEVLECEWGAGADEARLEEVLKKDTEKKIKAVCVVHNETTTGVTSDIAGVRKVRARR